ncbi:MAG: IS66 family transposase [Deltaproteobacteria bacterium]|nr:IS66 family transposase [Deltaproteobacteria bacterium]
MALADAKEASIEDLLVRLDALEREIKILREENALLKKWRFGRSSERLEPGQLSFFETGEWPEEGLLPELAPKRAKKPSKPVIGHGRALFPAHLERVEHRLDLCEADRKCPDCSSEMRLIGEDASERGRLIPAKMVVDRYVRGKYACPHGHTVKVAALPAGVVDGCKYDASVHAHIVTAKYNDHMPLNRLEGIFERHGIRIPKQTMWDMLVRVDELVAQPVLKQMRLELLEEPLLHADETSVVLRVEGKKGSKKGWVWGWRNEPGGDRPSKALIEFHSGRDKHVPASFLGAWIGTLLIDGFGSYNPICKANGITRAGCWAHARRYFREALEGGAADAAPLLRMISRLFALERGVRQRAERLGLSHDEMLTLRGKVRARSANPLLVRMLDAARELEGQRTVLPKSKLGRAVTYLLNQQKPLRTFIDDALVPIHNNDEERDLRHIIIGRKNWMVFASLRGGEVACRLYSLMLSCRQNGVNPEAYVADVLMAVETTPNSEIASLTPWAWGAARKAAAVTE